MDNDKLKTLKERGIISDELLNELQEQSSSSQMAFGRFIPEKRKEVSSSKLFVKRPKMEFVLFKKFPHFFDFKTIASRREWIITMLSIIILIPIFSAYLRDVAVLILGFLLLYTIFMPYIIFLMIVIFLLSISFDLVYSDTIRPQTLLLIVSMSLYCFFSLRVTICRLCAVQKKPCMMWIPFAVFYAACKRNKK